MLLILSSAKTLVFDDAFTVPETTQPIFIVFKYQNQVRNSQPPQQQTLFEFSF
jgi:hypothetical protein